MRRCVLGLLLGWALLVGTGWATAATTRYTVTDLGNVLPHAINDHGVVAGALQLAATDQWGQHLQHACRWQRGRTEDLGTLGGANSGANDINGRGQIAGWSETGEISAGTFPTPLHRPLLWTGSQGLPLGTGAVYNDATGVNDRGQVAVPAGIWERGKITALLVGRDEVGTPLDINNRGQIVASVENTNFTVDHTYVFASLRSRTRTMLPISDSIPDNCCINSKAHVAGTEFTMHDFAFYWDGKKLTPLTAYYAREGTATGINDSDVIAGSFRDAAVIWQRGVRIDLNGFLPADSPWVLQNATGINNHGQIVGIGTLKGEFHGFLLTPAGAR